jgi:hypothetical protein
MADAFEAYDRLCGRIVAIEALAPAFDRVRGFLARCRRGAHVAAHVNGPNIVAALDRASHDVTDSRRRGLA